MKMTPGPWFPEENRPGDWRVRIGDGKDGFWEIAEMSCINPEANARAIACLSELVEIARRATTYHLSDGHAITHSCGCDIYQDLRRILARIDGETS